MTADELRPKLRPCPFCGHEAVFRIGGTGKGPGSTHWNEVLCGSCTGYAALEHWNRRVPMIEAEPERRAFMEAAENLGKWCDTSGSFGYLPEHGGKEFHQAWLKLEMRLAKYAMIAKVEKVK